MKDKAVRLLHRAEVADDALPAWFWCGTLWNDTEQLREEKDRKQKYLEQQIET